MRFRYRLLDKARERGRRLSHRGASFQWRTINGEKASAYCAAGTAQYHIDADVAYAMVRYVELTVRHGNREIILIPGRPTSLPGVSKQRGGLPPAPLSRSRRTRWLR